jgi:hypothetical protein
MKSLVRSCLISGMLIGAAPGIVLLLPSIAMAAQRTACLVLIAIGSSLGLVIGLTLDTVAQIKRAPNNKSVIDWLFNTESINQSAGMSFASKAICMYFIVATLLLFGCLKLPTTEYQAWSFTADKPKIEFYQRPPSTAEIFWRVCVTFAIVLAVSTSIVIHRRLFRYKQPIDIDCTATEETATMKSATAGYWIGKRTILVCGVLLCAVFGWLVWKLAAAREQQQIVAELLKLGGSIAYDFEANSGPFQQNGRPPEPAWLVKIVGIDFFHDVVQVYFYDERPVAYTGNEITPRLRHLTHLQSLFFCNGIFRDEDLRDLDGLNSLEHLGLQNNGFTDNSVETIAKLAGLKEIYCELSSISNDGKRRLQQLRPSVIVH